jgi:hypothetical protein
MLDLPAVYIGAMLFAARHADPGPWFSADDHPHRAGSLWIAFALWQALSGDAVPVHDVEATLPEYTDRRAQQGGAQAPTCLLRTSAAQMAVIAHAIGRLWSRWLGGGPCQRPERVANGPSSRPVGARWVATC